MSKSHLTKERNDFNFNAVYFRYYDSNDNSSTIQSSTSAEKSSTSASTEETIVTSEATIIVKKDEIVLKPIVDPKVTITVIFCYKAAPFENICVMFLL